MVRAHVGGGAAGVDYLAAALSHIQPAPGCLVAIGGLPESGRSILARAIAPTLGPAPGALVLSGDGLRKRLLQSADSAEANRRVKAALLEAVGQAGDHAVIVDDIFLDPELRHAIAVARRPFIGIWLVAPLAERERCMAVCGGDASDITPDELRLRAAQNVEPIHWHRVTANAKAGTTCAALIRAGIGSAAR
jgi:predicted kinase